MARTARMLRLVSLAAVAACLTAAGCAQPILTEDEDRTPFDRYDAVRNRDEPASVPDVYGRRQPNLRGRLSRR